MRRKLGLFGCFSLLRVAVCAFVLLSVAARTFLVQCEKACTDVRFFFYSPPYIKKECWFVPQAVLVSFFAKPLTKGALEITLTLNELGLFLEF